MSDLASIYDVIGKTPYPHLQASQREWLIEAPISDLEHVLEIARQDPPNITIMSVISAVALSRSVMYGVNTGIPLSDRHQRHLRHYELGTRVAEELATIHMQ